MLLPAGHDVISMVNQIARAGKRVVFFARVSSLDPAVVREGLTPAALVVLSETVRPDAADTLKFFAEQGVDVKIISGDNPVTVAAIARSVGLHVGEPVDAHNYGSSVDDVRELAVTTTVFGRVSPEQKRSLVKALQENGHVVAMTGDGVNDVLALKQSDIGVAMNNGAPATKAVAQLVLLDGKFSHLPRVLAEGRRVIANVERVASLFVAKNAMSFVAIAAAGLLVVPFPLLPRHLSVLSSLAIGIPSFFLALGSNNRRYTPGFLRRVLRFALPAGGTVGVAVMVSNYISRAWFPLPSGTKCDFGDLTAAAANKLCWHDGTASVAAALIVSMWILVVLARPFNKWKLILVSSLSGVAALLFLVPGLQTLFDFSMPYELGVIVCGVGAAGAFVVEVLGRTLGTKNHA
jgi:cation-transporting ATPase E